MSETHQQQSTGVDITASSQPTEAITGFMIWMDIDGNLHAEIGPDIPVLATRREATLHDIANFSELMSHEARMEIYHRFATGEKEPTANIIKKALNKRKG